MFSSFMSYCTTMLRTLAGNPRQAQATKKAKSTGPIVLRTNDVVNADLASSWCEEHGLDLQVTDQRDELFVAEACALVIDLDQLALMLNERLDLVEGLSCVLPPYPVAVASYNLDERIVAVLRGHGVMVFRRIDRQLFYELAAALEHKFAASSA